MSNAKARITIEVRLFDGDVKAIKDQLAAATGQEVWLDKDVRARVETEIEATIGRLKEPPPVQTDVRVRVDPEDMALFTDDELFAVALNAIQNEVDERRRDLQRQQAEAAAAQINDPEILRRRLRELEGDDAR